MSRHKATATQPKLFEPTAARPSGWVTVDTGAVRRTLKGLACPRCHAEVPTLVVTEGPVPMCSRCAKSEE